MNAKRIAGAPGGRDPRQDAREGLRMCSQTRIRDLSPRTGPAAPPEGGSVQELILEQVYDPLQSCPPPLIRRYQRTAELARLGRVPQAAKLKCLDCCGWEHAEAKACAVSTCPLWLVNRRIFAQTPTRKDAA